MITITLWIAIAMACIPMEQNPKPVDTIVKKHAKQIRITPIG
jgi:hypothetical protein